MSTQITVKVTAGASCARVGPWMADGTLKLAVTAPPEDGRANEAVIALLSSTLGITASDVRIIRGRTSPRKVIDIAGWTPEGVRAVVAQRDGKE